MSAVIHINGWPGSGKLTIAKQLAPIIGARLIDNHTMINPAEALFSRGDRRYGQMRAELRMFIFDWALKVDADVPLIFTDALSDDDWDSRIFEGYRALAKSRGARLFPVVLEISAAQNEQRLIAADRRERQKLTAVETLRELRSRHSLLHGALAETIRIDVDELSPHEAAIQIARRSGLDGGG